MIQRTNRKLTGVWHCLVLLLIVVSCDLFEKDVVPNDKIVEVTRHDFFILPNSSTIIDLKSSIAVLEEVSISVTQPKRGKLIPIDEGILKFEPHANFTSGSDHFTVSFKKNGATLLGSDTIRINVRQDTTQFPCQLLAVEDVVYVKENESISIPVLENDRLCGVKRSSVKVEIYLPLTNGVAEVLGDTIIYTPGESLTGKDQIIYRISAPGEPATSLGLITILERPDTCVWQLKGDSFLFEVNALSSTVFPLNLKANDVLCDIDTTKADWNVVGQPKHGTVQIEGFGRIVYTKSSSFTHSITDSLVYRFCYAGVCQEAVVHLSFEVSSCLFKANNDVVDLRDSIATEAIYYVSILDNDQLCGEHYSLEFIHGPSYGTLYPYPDKLGYQPDLAVVKNDTIVYRVCSTGSICSEAKVLFLRE